MNFFCNTPSSPAGSPAPLSVSVACDDRVRDTCSIARGLNHTVRVTFDPKRDSSLVRSAISWRTWVEMPVPAQDSAACNYMSCPIRRGQRTTFSYNLNMPTYVMRVSGVPLPCSTMLQQTYKCTTIQLVSQIHNIVFHQTYKCTIQIHNTPDDAFRAGL